MRRFDLPPSTRVSNGSSFGSIGIVGCKRYVQRGPASHTKLASTQHRARML
jgi:hypothetical protein